MIEELYAYAYPKERLQQPVMDTKNKKGLIIFCEFFCIAIVSLPMLLTKILGWLLITLVYAALILCRWKEKNVYAQDLLSTGLTVIGITVFVIYAIGTYYSFGMFFLIMIPILLIAYEISVIINLKQKRFSSKNKKAVNKTTVNIFLVALAASSVGRFLGRKFRGEVWMLWLISVIIVFIFLFGFICVQKYVIFKILHKKMK